MNFMFFMALTIKEEALRFPLYYILKQSHNSYRTFIVVKYVFKNISHFNIDTGISQGDKFSYPILLDFFFKLPIILNCGLYE